MKMIKLLFIAVFLFMSTCTAMADEVEVVSSEGQVDVTKKGEDASVGAEAGMLLSEGDRIVTGEGSSARLSFSKETRQTVDVNEKSDVILKLDDGEKIELISGEVFAMVKGLKKGEEFRVRTPCATCGARGTAWLTATDAEKTNISVVDGSVFTKGINKDGTLMKKEYTVKKGYEREIVRFSKPRKVKKMPKSRMKRIETRFTRDGIKFSTLPTREGTLAVKDIRDRDVISTKIDSVNKIESVDKRDVLDSRDIIERRDSMVEKSRLIDDRVDSKVVERSDRMDKRDTRDTRTEIRRPPPPRKKLPPRTKKRR